MPWQPKSFLEIRKIKTGTEKKNKKQIMDKVTYSPEEYIYASARLRYLEKSLLPDSVITAIFDATKVEQINALLEERGFKIESSAEEALRKDLVEKYDLASSLVPDKEFMEALLLVRDYQNLKVLIKSLLAAKESTSDLSLDKDNVLTPSNYSLEDIHLALRDKKLEKENPVFHRLIEEALEIYRKNHDSGEMDSFIDKEYFSLLSAYDKALDNPFFHRYVTYRADSTNLLILLRLKAMQADPALFDNLYVSGGAVSLAQMQKLYNADPANFEKIYKGSDCQALASYAGLYGRGNTALEFGRKADDILIGILRTTRGILYGPEVVMAFLLANELQVKNINIALTCVRNDVPKTLAREMKRESFF